MQLICSILVNCVSLKPQLLTLTDSSKFERISLAFCWRSSSEKPSKWIIFICFIIVVLPAPAGPSSNNLKLESKLRAQIATRLSSSLLQFLNGSRGLKQEKDLILSNLDHFEFKLRFSFN